jgi:outer membrane protein OmpA-like peptidoglycan-associated protein
MKAMTTVLSRSVLGAAAATLVLAFSGCAVAPGSDPNYDKGGKAKAVKVKQTDRGVQLTSDERVLFETGRSDIKADGRIYIERVANILKTKTKANVAVEGHTDNIGGSALNQQLSVRRATAVRDGLIKEGVAASRIQAQGFGQNKPVASNDSAEGRQENRRTEIFVLGETEANIGGVSLTEQLNAGLDRLLQGATEIIQNVFGSGK